MWATTELPHSLAHSPRRLQGEGLQTFPPHDVEADAIGVVRRHGVQRGLWHHHGSEAGVAVLVSHARSPSIHRARFAHSFGQALRTCIVLVGCHSRWLESYQPPVLLGKQCVLHLEARTRFASAGRERRCKVATLRSVPGSRALRRSYASPRTS